MSLDGDFVAIFDRLAALARHKLEDLLSIRLQVVGHDVYRLLKLVLGLIKVNQDQVDEALEDALVFSCKSFEVELGKGA